MPVYLYSNVHVMLVGDVAGGDLAGTYPNPTLVAASVLAKLLTVDGVGSGLDADLLDGLSSAAFQLAIAIVASDPSAPADGKLWLLRETTGAIADGTAMGMMGFTYHGNTGTVLPLRLSVNDNGVTRRVAFA